MGNPFSNSIVQRPAPVIEQATRPPEQGELPNARTVARSAKWGEPYPIVYQVAGGRFFVPSVIRAGNVWSVADIDASTATRLGGQPGKHQVEQAVNTGNPFSSDYSQTGQRKILEYNGWFFDQPPPVADLEATATFRPGRGTSNKNQLQGLGLLAAALTAGAALAPAAAAGGSGLSATVSSASTLSELSAGGLGTGGGTGLSLGSAGNAAGAILGNPAAIAPAGLPGTGLSLGGVAGSSALGSVGAGTVVAGGAGLLGSPASSVLSSVNAPSVAAPATSPFGATPVLSTPTAPVAAPVSNSILQSAGAALETAKGAAATIQGAAQVAGGVLTLKSLLSGKPDTPPGGDVPMLMPQADVSRPITAPTVVVTGKPDNAFYLMLAGLAYLVWRL